MIEILGETIKSALIQELRRLMPDVPVYKEAITTPYFPHNFIYQLTLDSIEDRKGKYILDYLMTIRYRVASDPSTDLRLQQKLDNASMQLMGGFDTIPLQGVYIRGSNKRTEKVDGVLHFFLSVKLQVEKAEIPYIKQGTLLKEIGLEI